MWCVHVRGWTTLDENCPRGIAPPGSAPPPSSARPTDRRPCFRVCHHHRFQYSWRVSDWSACQPKRGSTGCEHSHGIQTRNVTCVANCGGGGAGGDAPANHVCHHFSPLPVRLRACRLSCPENCIVSGFGPWTGCRSCWVRWQTRYRALLAAPRAGGRLCPRMTQRRRCTLARSCYDEVDSFYQFKVGNWSECSERKEMELWRGAPSGHLGHSHRTTECIDHEGHVVNER